MNTNFPSKSISVVTKVITSPVDKKTMEDEIPVFLCNYTDVYYNPVINENMTFMEATAKQSEVDRFSLHPNDVVITKDSESADDIGIPTYIQSVKENLLCGYHLTILRPNKHVDGRFLSFALQHPKISYDFYKYANGITRFGLTSETYNKIKIPLPLLSEQKAIADLLATWDEAIEKTERLIQAKERQLDAYARDLFVCKKDGNCNGWKVVKLKNVLTEHGDKSTGSEEVYSVSVHKGLINQIEHLGRSFSAANTDNYNCVHYGDIVYTKSPTGDFPLGVVKQSYTEKDVIVSPLYGVFTPQTFNLGIILDFYFSSPLRARNYLFPIMQKGAKNTIAITNKTFLSKSLHLPIDEKAQEKVADFVYLARQEIALLKQLVEKYKTQKRGLMQKMLTGIWRIKPEIINQYTEV